MFQNIQIEYEGWCKSWDNPDSGIPKADLTWVKEDPECGLFGPVQTYIDKYGVHRKRRVLKNDRMWFHPREIPGVIGSSAPTPDLFFRNRVFFWRPVGVWNYSLKCPRKNCPGKDDDVYLHRSGYYKIVRHICDLDGWYTMRTEVLSCGPCFKAAKNKEEGHTLARFRSWDREILCQLSPAHQSMFSATLTVK